MATKRFHLRALPVQNFLRADGTVEQTDDEYGVSIVLAALVRELLANRVSMFAGVAVSKEYIAEIMERGAWLEIDDADGTIDVRVALK